MPLLSLLTRSENILKACRLPSFQHTLYSLLFLILDLHSSFLQIAITPSPSSTSKLLACFQVTDSAANFLFVTHPEAEAKALLDGLREKGILVRWWDSPRIRDYLRITVGTRPENDTLLEALRKYTE